MHRSLCRPLQGGWDTGSQAALAYDIAGGWGTSRAEQSVTSWHCLLAPAAHLTSPIRIPHVAALRLRGEGTATNFHPTHYQGAAQQLAVHSIEEVVAALRALSRGGPAARQVSSRFRGVSRHQKVGVAARGAFSWQVCSAQRSWHGSGSSLWADSCCCCTQTLELPYHTSPPQGKWEARIGGKEAMAGKRYVYLGLHDSGEGRASCLILWY